MNCREFFGQQRNEGTKGKEDAAPTGLGNIFGLVNYKDSAPTELRQRD